MFKLGLRLYIMVRLPNQGFTSPSTYPTFFVNHFTKVFSTYQMYSDYVVLPYLALQFNSSNLALNVFSKVSYYSYMCYL